MKSELIITENELPATVIAAIKDGRKIEAIKILQDATGLGLANAKVLVDRAWATHGPYKPPTSFADRPSGLTGFFKLLSMALLILAAWYFYTSA